MKNNSSLKRLVQLLLCVVGLAMQLALFSYFYYTYYISAIKLDFWRRGHILIILIYFFLLYLFTSMYGGMKIGQLRNVDLAIGQVVSIVIVNVVEYFEISLLCYGLMYPWNYVRMSLEQIVIAVGWVIISNWLCKSIFPPRQLLLIHGDRPIEDIVSKFESRKDKFVISKTINIRDGVEKACLEALERYDAVVIWDIPTAKRNQVLKFCYGKDIRVYIMPKISDVILSGAEQLHIFDTPILLTREYSINLEQRFIKRMIDIVCSLILIVITSPFMLITAIAVKLCDRGPILYKQVRCTINCKEFKILKFRSMRVDAEKDGVARLAQENDDRITPVGRFIRKVRLDELPQLFNILKGDMSFIGPRPERPEIIDQYMDAMPEFAYRMKVKAGLAGYAQVYGKYNTTPYDKLKLDLCYIEQYSIWLDIKLMFLTLKVLFTPDATQGVLENQITAMKEESKEEHSN